jgi:hypothetical protein
MYCTSSLDAWIPDLETVASPPGLADVQHIDGFGSPAQTLAKYGSLRQPNQFTLHFKVFTMRIGQR